MTKKEAKQMEQLLKEMPPKYSDYEETYGGEIYRAVDSEEWHKMVITINRLRDMYFKKLYLEGNNERKS